MESGTDEVSKIKDCYEHFMFCEREMQLGHEKFLKKQGTGIYRRVFHWVPLSGPDSVDRRIQQCRALEAEELESLSGSAKVGIKKLHQLADVGKPGV